MIIHTRIVRRDQPDNGVWQKGPDLMADDLKTARKMCAKLMIIPEGAPAPKPWWKRLFS